MKEQERNHEILIFGRIGGAVSAYEIANQVKECGNEKITVKISSYGGDLGEGIAIYNILKDYRGGVESEIIGICASAATIIAMAGNTVKMKSNGLFILHEPTISLWEAQNESDLRKKIDQLGKMNESIVEVYASRTKLDKEEIREMLKGEKCLNAEESKAKGFIDEILPITENQESKPEIQVFDEIREKVLNEERKRINELESAKTTNMAINAIIDQAKMDGKTLPEIQPYLRAINSRMESQRNQRNMYKDQILDYLSSGASEVLGNVENTNRKGIEDIVKYANEGR